MCGCSKHFVPSISSHFVVFISYASLPCLLIVTTLGIVYVCCKLYAMRCDTFVVCLALIHFGSGIFHAIIQRVLHLSHAQVS